MGGVFGNNQHERFYYRLGVLPGINFKLDLGVFMKAHAVFQFKALKAGFVIVACVEVLPGGDGGFFYKAVGHGAGKRVTINNVLKRNIPACFFHLRGSRQL